MCDTRVAALRRQAEDVRPSEWVLGKRPGEACLWYGPCVHREPLATHDGKILVVDDDPLWRELCRTYLEDDGYQALTASSGPEALEVLSREPCSVLLLDLRMPGMGGREVVEQLPREGRPRVVFVTSASDEEVGQALWNEPHYYLPKQASQAELSLLLQSLEAH